MCAEAMRHADIQIKFKVIANLHVSGFVRLDEPSSKSVLYHDRDGLVH